MEDNEYSCQECGRELEELSFGQEQIGEEEDRIDYLLRSQGSCLSCGTINLRESYFSLLYGNHERQVKEEASESTE